MGFPMTKDPLPDQDHISRYCAPKTAPDGQPTGVSFMLKPSHHFLSVNWLEYFDFPDRQAQLTQVRQVIELALAANGRFAVLNVGEVIDYVSKNGPDNRLLSVLNEPTAGDPSHSGIHGYGLEDDWVADLLAEIVQETYPAKEP